MPVVAKLLALSHVLLYRATGGILGGKLLGCPVLLLTTTGRHSGKPLTVPLLYVAEGEGTGYFPSGRIMYRGTYKAGVQAGMWTWYNEDGTVRSKQDYANPS